MKLGEKIRALRKKKYTQEELAERLGVHVNTIVRWERGDRMPTADKLKVLADILGTTPSELLSLDDNIQDDNIQDQKVEMENSSLPYTQAQTLNRGMLIYDLGNGKKMELPPTEASYNFLRDIAIHAARPAVMA